MSDARFLKWGIGKPAGFVAFAWFIAANADEIITFVNRMLTGEHLDRLPKPPSVEEMLRQYGDESAMFVDLCGVMVGLQGAIQLRAEDIPVLLDELRAFSKLLPEELEKVVKEVVQAPDFKEMFKAGGQAAVEMFNKHRDEVRANLKGESNAKPLSIEDAGRPAMQFFYRVWCPCMFLYGESAHRLYARAQKDDSDALIKLVRLDKSILGNPRIADQLHQAHAGGKRGLAAKISAAIKGRCKRLTPRQAKIRLGNLILLLAKPFKAAVTAPEIKRLFDAVAAAKKSRVEIDTDLPGSETWARELRLGRGALEIFKFLGQIKAEKD